MAVLAMCFHSHPGPALAEEAPDPKWIFIEVQADGTSCLVRTVKLPCEDVLTHLRSDLKLAAGTWVRFKADRSAPYQSVKAVMDAVQKSEFSTSAAYIPAPRSTTP